MTETNKEVSKETKSVKKETVKKDIDYSVVYAGPLHVPQEYLNPGFVHQLVSDKPGEIAMYQAWGYEIVLTDDIPEIEKKPSQSSRFGAAYTIQSKCGQTLVLMKISKELHGKLMAFRDSQNKAVRSALGHIDNVPEELAVGKLTVGPFNRPMQ